jgi:hypothetical protein
MEPHVLTADDSGSVDESSADLPVQPHAGLPRIVIEPGLRNALLLLLGGFVLSGIGGIVGIVIAHHQIADLPPGSVIGQLGLTLHLVGVTAIGAAINVILGIIILLLGGRTPAVWFMAVFLLFSSFAPFAFGEVTKSYYVKAHHLFEDEAEKLSS